MATPFDLSGRVAVVTGAGRGIGRALAEGLAGLGADVVCLARTASEIEAAADAVRAKGRRALAIQADVTDREAVTEAVARTVAELGRLDVLVNNAGTNVRVPALEVGEDDFDLVVRTNLRGPFFMAQAAGRVMCEAGRGRIVNVASVGGGVALHTGVAYGSSKAGLIHMTRILALEWAPRGVTVNAVGPWYFRTPLTEGVLDDPAYLARVVDRTPMGRVGQVAELVGPVAFLASDAASYVTGQVLYVDGGMTVYGF